MPGLLLLKTPDGRYLIVKDRLWRTSNPALNGAVRQLLVDELMKARRAVQRARTPAALAAARGRVERAKRQLGERGPVWWTDGSPDFNRRLVKNTPYAAWYRDCEF